MNKLFLILGIVFLLLWLLTTFGPPLPLLGRLGHLPGDIHVQKEHYSFHFPIASSIVVSVILTLFLRLLSRF